MGIKFITYNCHLGLTGRMTDDETDRRDKIINDLRTLDADVIGLCEVWKDKEYQMKIIEALEDKYRYHFFDKAAHFHHAHGLMMLSKFPIYNNGIMYYKEEADFDILSNKAFFFGTIHLGTREDFNFVFTHTQAGKEYGSVRATQFAQMAQVAIKNGQPNGPTILLGDFNIDQDQTPDEYNNFNKQFSCYCDSYRIACPNEKGYTYDPQNNDLAKKWDSKGAKQRLDYFYLSAGTAATTQWKKPASSDIEVLKWPHSDHYPLLIKNLAIVEKSAIAPNNLFNTEADATNEVNAMKKAYGTGCSAKLNVHSEDVNLEYYGSAEYKGSFSKNPPPYISPGQWAGIFYHHPNGEALGAEAGMLYRISGTDWLVFLGFVVPHSDLYKNKTYVEIFLKGEWESDKKKAMYKSIENGKYFSISNGDESGYVAESVMSKGNSPLCTFKVKKA